MFDVRPRITVVNLKQTPAERELYPHVNEDRGSLTYQRRTAGDSASDAMITRSKRTESPHDVKIRGGRQRLCCLKEPNGEE
jgi:hypothetical protein